jgi:hypothetical protein
MGMCTSSCALIWIGGETGRKFLYQDRPGLLTFLCFHQASYPGTALSGHALRLPSGPGNESISKYLADLGYKRDMIEWATAAGPKQRRCLNSDLAIKFNIDSWLNTEDGQHHTLPGNHGLLDGVTLADERVRLADERARFAARARELGPLTPTSTCAVPQVYWLWIPGVGLGQPRNDH